MQLLMRAHARLELDLLMRHLMVVGFIALAGWTLTAAAGYVSDTITIAPQPTLRFLLAILILVFSRRTYWELREWRWSKLSPDERSGFTNPLWEHPRPTERPEGPGAG